MMMSGYLFGMCIEGRQIAYALLSELFGFPNWFLFECLFGGQGNLPELQFLLWREKNCNSKDTSKNIILNLSEKSAGKKREKAAHGKFTGIFTMAFLVTLHIGLQKACQLSHP